MSLLAPCPGCDKIRQAREGHHFCPECEGERGHVVADRDALVQAVLDALNEADLRGIASLCRARDFQQWAEMLDRAAEALAVLREARDAG